MQSKKMYAQLNEDNICIGVIECTHVLKGYIRIFNPDNVLYKQYQDGQWIDVGYTPPAQKSIDQRLDELVEQHWEIKEAIADLSTEVYKDDETNVTPSGEVVI
jgi:hypothetical protein